MDNILVSLYEVKRQNFLIAYKQNPEFYDPALAYAYDKRIAPYLHQTAMKEAYNGHDPFEYVYAIKADFVKDVLSYIDEKSNAKDYASLQYSKLAERYSSYYKDKSYYLAYVLEYARLSGQYDDYVWSAIQKEGAYEYTKTDTYDPKAVYVD